MAKFQVQGVEEYARKLSRMGERVDEVGGRAVHKGAGVVADAVKAGLKSIPVQEGYGTPEEPLRGLSRRQKADVINGFGISPMQLQRGYLHVKVGFDGYGSIKTRKYPQGIPNQLLMRSVESGTSFRKKSPVIRKAVNTAKKRAVDAMNQSIEKDFKKEFGG